MRLAVLASHPIQYYSPLFRELARRLDLHVFYAHRATPEDQANSGFGVPFAWDTDLAKGYSHSFLLNLASKPSADQFQGCDTPEIGEKLRDGQFDALLVLGWHLKSFLQGVWAAKLQKIPVMVRGDSHLGTPRSKIKLVGKSAFYPGFLRLFDAALYVGQRAREYYEHYRYPQNRLFFSPHCIDTAWFGSKATPEARSILRSRLNISDAAPAVLFAGKLVPFKRPNDLILAAALCRESNIPAEVIIAGSGLLQSEVSRQAEELGVPLHMLGFQNQTQMPEAYAASDMLALPSNGQETWGLVANEALACGRPIIVSDACGCAPDLAADGRAGRTFALAEAGALARAIAELAGRPPSKNVIDDRSQRYGIGPAADGIEAAIDRCVAGKRRRARRYEGAVE